MDNNNVGKLKDALQSFNPPSEKSLDKLFADLAMPFLYGGYLSVKYNSQERYRIYIRTVEFYCHYEGKGVGMPRDLIVYHRNDKYVKGNVPYFPLMAIHAHTSGLDITFENEALKLRSSALIRAYEVYDVVRQKFLCYDKSEKLFRECGGENDRINKQSTYLYNFINGFIDDSVKWFDDVRVQHNNLKVTPRQNVFQYNHEGNKTTLADRRPWSFTRVDSIPDDKLTQKVTSDQEHD